jgi:hypothetical protein
VTDRRLREDEARYAAQWVGYELRSAARARQLFLESGEQLIAEALAAHHRAILEFLVGRPPHKPGDPRRWSKRDFRPHDLCDDWVAPPLPAGPYLTIDLATYPTIDKSLQELDQWLSHLSRARLALMDEVGIAYDDTLTGGPTWVDKRDGHGLMYYDFGPNAIVGVALAADLATQAANGPSDRHPAAIELAKAVIASLKHLDGDPLRDALHSDLLADMRGICGGFES